MENEGFSENPYLGSTTVSESEVLSARILGTYKLCFAEPVQIDSYSAD